MQRGEYLMYNDDDFDLKTATNIMEIPEDLYYKLLEEYDVDEIEAYINRDDDLFSMDITTFVNLKRIEDYGLSDDEMESGHDD